MSFTTFIKRQQHRNDALGDYAKDFVYIMKNLLKYPECRGTDQITSETLLGHYKFLPHYARNRDYILEAACRLWREWLEYKYIGLKYGRPKNGYVYFFHLPQKKDVFKIGRTRIHPEKRLAAVAAQERTDLKIYDWIKLDHYNIIEKELHSVFQPWRLMREWFEIHASEIDEAVRIYSLTDSAAEVYSFRREEEEYDGKFA